MQTVLQLKEYSQSLGNRALSFEQVSEVVHGAGNKALQRILGDCFSERLTFEELRSLSDVLPFLQDHQCYQRILRGFDPGLELLGEDDPDNAFVGEGSGGGSLNCYRKVKDAQGRWLFEKIYLTNSTAWIRKMWFYTSVYHRLDPAILTMPMPVRIQYGDRLAAVYYDFVNAEQLSHSALWERCVELFQHFTFIKASQFENPPDFVFDFQSYPSYKRGLLKAREFVTETLALQDTSLLQIERLIAKLPRYFCHGDFDRSNILADHIVVDWDKCGLYPLGYDVAVAVDRLAFSTVASVTDFLEDKYKHVLTAEQWQGFRLAVLYFVFVFYFSRSRSQKSEQYPVLLYQQLEIQLSAFVQSGHQAKG